MSSMAGSVVPSSQTKWYYVNGSRELGPVVLLAAGLLLTGCYLSAISPGVQDIGRLQENNEFAEFNNFYTAKFNEDVQNYMDKSKQGVIVFSMGSKLRATSWPRAKLKAFQEAFLNLPQNILWKWEDDTMTGKPENVKIVKRLPQYDLLNHTNVKALITLVGGPELSEAVQCGVPVLAIRVYYGDQIQNSEAVKDSVVVDVLDYNDITTENILAGLRNILEPKTHKKTALSVALDIIYYIFILALIIIACIWIQEKTEKLAEIIISFVVLGLVIITGHWTLQNGKLVLEICSFFTFLGLLTITVVCIRAKRLLNIIIIIALVVLGYITFDWISRNANRLLDLIVFFALLLLILLVCEWIAEKVKRILEIIASFLTHLLVFLTSLGLHRYYGNNNDNANQRNRCLPLPCLPLGLGAFFAMLGLIFLLCYWIKRGLKKAKHIVEIIVFYVLLGLIFITILWINYRLQKDYWHVYE